MSARKSNSKPLVILWVETAAKLLVVLILFGLAIGYLVYRLVRACEVGIVGDDMVYRIACFIVLATVVWSMGREVALTGMTLLDRIAKLPGVAWRAIKKSNQ